MSRQQSANRPLFRQQALDTFSYKLYGTILLTTPRKIQILSIYFFALAIALIVFFFVFTTTRKVVCQCVLIPNSGAVKLLPTQTGVVLEKRVSEGQVVQQSDVLFVLSNERSNEFSSQSNEKISDLLSARQRSVKNELGQLQQQKILALQQREVDLKTATAQTENQITFQTKRIELSEKNLNDLVI